MVRRRRRRTDAVAEIPFDPESWPVFRVPAAEGPGAVVVYRNRVGDYGIDYLLTHPGRSHAQQIAGWEGGFTGTGLTWPELVRMADSPALSADGVEDSADRLLLALPLLDDLDVPETGHAGVSAALTAAGAARDTAPNTAMNLLTHLMGRPRHDRTWDSPLSGS